jgi:hypothetical protein
MNVLGNVSQDFELRVEDVVGLIQLNDLNLLLFICFFETIFCLLDLVDGDFGLSRLLRFSIVYLLFLRYSILPVRVPTDILTVLLNGRASDKQKE